MTSPFPVWGWTDRVRILLANIAGGLAISLLAGALGDRRPTIEPPSLVVDPNTAPAAVLEALPGIGQARRAALIAERQHAPFRSLDDLDQRVKGIGPATIAALKPFLRIEPPAQPPPTP
jgi:competence protein ComEA